MANTSEATGCKERPLRLYIVTYGCQMNDSDSEVIQGILHKSGYRITKDEKAADIFVLNTCSVRVSAENKALGKMRELGKLKKNNPNLILCFCGCMAQKHKEDLFKKVPRLDIVCGTNAINKLPDLIKQVSVNREYLTNVSLMDSYPVDESIARRNSTLRAWVPIMRGCDNYCSYCVVPYVRGKEISRPADEILKEITVLAEKGYQEVNLLGQNVNSYGKGKNCESVKFPDLLRKINDIEGIQRIRFVTSHPKDISDELISLFGKLNKLCKYMHFPIQSGSDRILKLMNRRYSVEGYIDIVKKLRKQCPDIALSSDIIIGYPTETEEDFQKTVEVLETIEYDSAYIFKYSTREGTEAAKYPDNVPLKIKEERLKFLMELQEKICLKKNEELIGKNVEILIEGPSAKRPDRMMGRTRGNKIAVIEQDDIKAGDTVVKPVIKATAWTLYC